MEEKVVEVVEQSRWRSKVAWLTLLPIIVILGDAYGLWAVINMPKDVFSQLYVLVMSALVAFGIFNNPKDKENF